MADNNAAYPLRLLSDIGVNLLDCEHKTPKPAANGYPYIAIPNIQDGRLDLTDVRRITESDFKEWTKKIKPQAGDIIVTRRGRVGDTAVVPSNFECAIGQNLVILRSDNSIVDQRYLRWALRGPLYEQQVDKFLNVGAIFYSLNCRDIPKFEVPLPSLSEQKSIAHILGTLDDKIELNRRMNETLEAMARATFKSWFVDFDPVRAKMDGRKPSGMDDATAALFPDSFEDSELGLIPKGWRTGSVLEQADLLSGGTPKTSISNYWDGEIPWASAKDVSQCGETFLIATERTISAEGLENSSTKIIDPFSTVIVARGATTGRMTMFGDQIAMNQTCYALRSKNAVHFFLYCQARHIISGLVHSAHGSVFDTITTRTFETTSFLLPDEKLTFQFHESVEPIFERVLANLYESRRLATIRDTLLPKLLSGEIRVSEAEQTVAEVA